MKSYIDITKPRHDQSSFEGRAKHFFSTTNPLNCLASDAELDAAKNIVDDYLAKKLPGDYDQDKLWQAKELVDSAFHPDTGEKLFLMGRMSFQVPGNMLITGCMMTFYRSSPAVIFWQFANQSFNAIVNYTNRNASAGVTSEQIGQAYLAATTASVSVALIFNKIISRYPLLAGGLLGRLVPLAAVSAANCVNIPLMRQQEIKQGIAIEKSEGTVVGNSKNAAINAIVQVIPSRIGMAIPAMFIPPLIMSRLEKSATYIRHPWLRAPTMVLATGLCLTFSTPLCCALFPQKAFINIADIEQPLQNEIKAKFPTQNTFYYNKGL